MAAISDKISEEVAIWQDEVSLSLFNSSK